MTNTLYYGDNLDVLRLHVKDESVDLVYLDPPFNSNQNYNVLFKQKDGSGAPAQIRAFQDTWGWDESSSQAFHELVEAGGSVARAMECFRVFLGQNDVLAYLSMMAPRLVEMRRVMKPTGSLYLHCDPAASHYLKMLLDAVFGPECFVNEITWRRTYAHGNAGKRYGDVCDILLFYTKSDEYCWNQPYAGFDPEYVKKYFNGEDDDGRRWQSVTLRNPSRRPNLHYPFKGRNGVTYQPHPNGWSCDEKRMRKYDEEARLHFPSKKGGQLRLKMYLDESPGVKVPNFWGDIFPVNSQAKERIGYPTQKPRALLERIIESSSNAGETVLDPFCGCGTAIDAAQKLGRSWIGIDVTHLSVAAIKSRLYRWHDIDAGTDYEVRGEPTTLDEAHVLALNDRHGFEHWALGLVNARASAKGKGADGGIDGHLTFYANPLGGWEQGHIVVSVKSGKNVGVAMVRDLGHVVAREKADIGVLILLAEPTKPMRTEAAQAGLYASPWGAKHRKLQILTVEQLLDGAKIDAPPTKRDTGKKDVSTKAA